MGLSPEADQLVSLSLILEFEAGLAFTVGGLGLAPHSCVPLPLT